MREEIHHLRRVKDDLLEALREIAMGKGAFDRDVLVHAENTIENMKSIAREAISKAQGEE